MTYDSCKEKVFVVHNTSTGDKKFIRSKGGLHYYDIGLNNNNKFSLLQTVHDNKQEFTKKEIAKANKARDLYIVIGRPGYQVFYNMLQRQLITNCDITMGGGTSWYAMFSCSNAFNNALEVSISSMNVLVRFPLLLMYYKFLDRL